jgi:hypothetical protein
MGTKFIYGIFILLSMFCYESLATTPFPLEKNRSIITTEFKGYQISSSEDILLYGAKHRKFITDTWYWGEAGYGALFGKRSGYLEGGVIVGNMQTGPGDTILDLRLFTGAGGGGSAPQGGGFIIHPTIGIGKNITHEWFLMTEIGYMHFVNGDISSLSVAVSLNMNMWTLHAK